MSDLLKINVNDRVEKKNGLTYLSWAWAWAEVLKADPAAQWEVYEFETGPVFRLPDESCMVKTIVTIKGVSRACWLPVMDYKNKAIKSPDAFAVNTAIMRCLAKCIAMHGLGLYVYAGEDLPEEDKPEPHSAISAPKEAAKSVDVSDDRKAELDECALIMIEAFDRDNGMASLELWRGLSDNDEKIYVWNELRAHSKLRAFIKANKQ